MTRHEIKTGFMKYSVEIKDCGEWVLYEDVRKGLEEVLKNLNQDKKVNGAGLFEPYIAQIERLLE